MGKRTVNKTRFIASFPFDTPAREILEAGRKQGISFTEAYVYRARALARGQQRAEAPLAIAPSTSPRERAFRRLVVELGVARARELLAAVESALHELIGH